MVALPDEAGPLAEALAGNLRALDGVHPLRDGYRLMAERVAAWPAWRALLDGKA